MSAGPESPNGSQGLGESRPVGDDVWAVLYSTRARLLVALLPLIALATLLTLGGLHLFLESFFRQRMAAEVNRLADALSASLKQQMLGRVDDVMQSTLEEIGGRGDITSIIILDSAGRAAHAFPAALRERVFQPAREPRCRECHRGPGPPTLHVVLGTDPAGTPTLRVASPVVNEARCHGCHDPSRPFNGLLLIERAATTEERALGTIRRRFILTWLLTLVVATVVVVSGATVLVHRPVQRLIRAARRIGSGDLTARVDVPLRSELGELATSFNGMAASLATSLDEVRHKNVELSVLYTMVDRISRNVFVGELKPMILHVMADMLASPRAVLASCTDEPGEIELLERQADGTVVRRFVRASELTGGGLPVPGAVLTAWIEGRRSEVSLDEERTLAVLPLRVRDHDLALLAVAARPGAEFGVDDLRLMNAIRDHMSVAMENARLYTLAITDDLTQLYSVRHFQTTLEDAIRRYERYGQPVALLMLDLDHFKDVNDTYGHPAGDSVLKEVGRRVRASVREVDVPCRYGGEEFMVILPHTDRRAAHTVAGRIRSAVAATPFTAADGQTIRVTISIGLAACPRDATTARELVTLADRALYDAKRSGRNQVRAVGGENDLEPGRDTMPA
jgi:diguanylate cyclase (GGDEF)-like protein